MAQKKKKKDNNDRVSSLRFSRVNLILVAAGLVSISVGYLLLSQGSVTAAPILLVLGYVVFIPLGLIL